MTITVTVQCVACKARKEIVAGDVSPDSVPMCDRCYNPMVAVSATAEPDPNEEHLKAHPQYPRKGRGKKGR